MHYASHFRKKADGYFVEARSTATVRATKAGESGGLSVDVESLECGWSGLVEVGLRQDSSNGQCDVA